MNLQLAPSVKFQNPLFQEKLIGEISNFQNFKLFTHKNPDGDAIGSMLALYRILNSLGKSAEMFAFDSIDERFFFFPDFEKIKIRKKIGAPDNSLIIYVDCSDSSRTGFEKNFFEEKKAIVIDHHLDKKEENPNILKIIDSAASSTAEIIFTLAESLNWTIDRDTSICLLSGIITDTGTFQHSNTSPQSLQIVSCLVKSGINLKKLADKLFKKRNFNNSLKIWGEILSRASFDQQTKMAYSCVFQNDLEKHCASEDEMSGLVNLLSGIPESRFSLLLIEDRFGKIKGSLRSESYKAVDVARIARSFGGGGHKLAAGFEIEGKIKEKFEEIKKKIQEELIKQQANLEIFYK